MKWISVLKPRFENQVQTRKWKTWKWEAEFQVYFKKSTVAQNPQIAKLPPIVLNGLFKLGIALAFRGANELCSCTFFSCKKIGKNLTAIWQLNTLYLVTGYAFMVNQAYQRA